jgi:formylglycine-generating enzyme required for sulfatase activity
VLEAFRRQYGAANPFYDRLAEARIEELRRRQVAMLKAEEERRRAEAEKKAEAELPRPVRVFRDCPDVCPEMVVVPAGSFTMGSPPGENSRYSDESPQHEVRIARSFAVGRFEVTFAEWEACVAAGGCRHRPNDQGWGRSRRPVIDVSWDDITKEYLPWLSRRTGKAYRLLTEAEWEYAARAGTTTRYHFGDNISKNRAQYLDGSRGSASRTVPVGTFQPNVFGLYDMHGNVGEWVQDCWNDYYYDAPSDGSAWTTGDCGRRVLRGGSWNNGPRGLRSADRGGNFPDSRVDSVGFRVGRTL